MRLIGIFSILLLIGSCKMNNKAHKVGPTTPEYIPGAPVIVYKAVADYSDLVPVLLSDDKTEIVSYPHPQDVKVGKTFLTPTSLNDGYLLDNKGIGENVAFLKWTYKEYAALMLLPSIEELYRSIVDKNPLAEIYQCGYKSDFDNIQQQLNNLIKRNELDKICEALKVKDGKY